MITSLLLTALISQLATGPQPYGLGATATADGAKRTVARLFAATEAGDDVAFEKVARGMLVMLAPDFGVPVSRLKFANSLKDCTDRKVESAAPFPEEPRVQSVRISMRCHDNQHPQPIRVVADIMADDEHAFVMFPGGVAKVWPAPKP